MEDKDKDVKEDLLRRKTEAILVPSGGPKSGVQVNLKRSSLPVEFHRLPSFSQVDVDGNGKIDFQEFKSVFPGIPEDEVIEMFNQVDVDHDGQLDRVEFETWVRSSNVLHNNVAIWYLIVHVIPENESGGLCSISNPS